MWVTHFSLAPTRSSVWAHQQLESATYQGRSPLYARLASHNRELSPEVLLMLPEACEWAQQQYEPWYKCLGSVTAIPVEK